MVPEVLRQPIGLIKMSQQAALKCQ